MAHQCTVCKLGTDRPGMCLVCRQRRRDEAQKRTPSYMCIWCRAPFPVGHPHGRCLQKMLRRASKGLPPPSFWRSRRWSKTQAVY